jgi:hypothetical protein
MPFTKLYNDLRWLRVLPVAETGSDLCVDTAPRSDRGLQGQMLGQHASSIAVLVRVRASWAIATGCHSGPGAVIL